jgi:3-(methylthio)propanoyl-CoA dehydrogenase
MSTPGSSSNYFTDNDDLRFYMEKGINWSELLDHVEFSRAVPGAPVDPEAPTSLEEAVEFYTDVLNMAGELAAQEVAPRTAEIDREHSHIEDGEVISPPALQAIWDALAESGLTGLCLPRELGGMNAPLMVYMLNAEVLARADVSVMTHHSFHGGIAMALLMYSALEGTTEFDPKTGRILSTRFSEAIEGIAGGTEWGSMDLTEPDAGSDLGALRSKGEQDDGGSWFVTGSKVFITSGNGRWHLVICRTEAAKAGGMGLDGLSLFLVDAEGEDADGNPVRQVTVERLEEKLGHAASPTCLLSYERAPAELIGERGDGFKQMLLLMNNARIGVGFESLGICEAAWRMARDYAAQRPSMGKTIDKHEMIADLLDEMYTDCQAIRALAVDAAYNEELSQRKRLMAMYLAADGTDEQTTLQKDAKRKQMAARKVTPLLKWYASEAAMRNAQRCVQIHGGVGYTKEYGAEKLLRDAMVLPIYEGTSQIQALMAMKDSLLGVMKDPSGFVKEAAETRFKARFGRDGLERRVAGLRMNCHTAQRHLMVKIGMSKVLDLRGKPTGEWKNSLTKDWDPKRDFAPAMLHAERLISLLTDAAIAEVLLEQARKHPAERADVLVRWLERAEPRSRYQLDVMRTTGERILDLLSADRPVDAAAAAAR